MLWRRGRAYSQDLRERVFAAEREADAIILDLEDAVAPSQKKHARTLIAEAIPQVSRNGADLVVRVNRPCWCATWRRQSFPA
jgi:citrate lyase beta subunit